MSQIYWNDQGQIIADVGQYGRFCDRAYVFTLTDQGWVIGRPRDPDDPHRHTSFTGQLYPTASRAAGRLLDRDDLVRLGKIADPVQLALADDAAWKFRQISKTFPEGPDNPRWAFAYARDVDVPPLNMGCVYLWCVNQFGRPRKRWTYAPAPRLKDDQFQFRDEAFALGFKMRWC